MKTNNTGQARKIEAQKIRADYAKNPKICPTCEGAIPFDKKRNTYCSHKCAKSQTNKDRAKYNKKCLSCDKIINGKDKKFCSHKCAKIYQRKELHAKIEAGEYKTCTTMRVIMSYLIEKRGRKCECCGISDWMGKEVPLNVHHIDGDATNNLPDNIQLLCLNCHGQTENYGRKNKNSSRNYRYSNVSSDNFK